jgi:hypothetical protein
LAQCDNFRRVPPKLGGVLAFPAELDAELAARPLPRRYMGEPGE